MNVDVDLAQLTQWHPVVPTNGLLALVLTMPLETISRRDLFLVRVCLQQILFGYKAADDPLPVAILERQQAVEAVWTAAWAATPEGT